MYLFPWDKNFETGLSEVDRQHNHLVSVINEFGELISLNEVNQTDLEKIFSELVSYTQYHFGEEEKLMAEIGVDDRFSNYHQQEHLGFLQDVTLMHQHMNSSGDRSGKELFEFLTNWLIYHIMGTDMSLARQIKSIQNGRLAEIAYHDEDHAVDRSTGLLLKSLHKLFQQVSNRNKQLHELNQTLEIKVEERTRALSELNRKLGELALTDVLTGLSNRRHCIQLLEQLWGEPYEKALPLSCMMIDADGFKKINDTYGHDAGDIVLCEFAKQLKYAVRTDDVVCRLGGDEFMILCPNTDLEGAILVATLTHAKIAGLTVRVAGGAWQGSISVGVAVRTGSMQRPEDLLKAADLGVYAAKSAGRNCVRIGG